MFHISNFCAREMLSTTCFLCFTDFVIALLFFTIWSPRITVVWDLVLAFEMIDFGACESVSFRFNYFSDSLSLLSIVTRNSSKHSMIVSLLANSCFKNSIWSNKFLIKNLSHLSFDLFSTMQIWSTINDFKAIISARRFSVSVIVCSFWCLSSFCDLMLLGMHDKLADFEITEVLFAFRACVSQEEKWWGLKWPLVSGEFCLH